jgi:hypothetical protein
MAINSTQLTTNGDSAVYTSSGTNAIVTLIICNTGNPDPAGVDETINSCTITINFVRLGDVSSVTNTVVKNLIVPAGETIFFSDEKVVLDNGDQVRATASVANLLSITVSTLPV